MSFCWLTQITHYKLASISRPSPCTTCWWAGVSNRRSMYFWFWNITACRAVATGPVSLVSPVQPYHFLPHPWLAWLRQIGPMLGERSWHAHSELTCWNMVRDGCKQYERISSNNFPFSSKWTIQISLASLICEGCSLCGRKGRYFVHVKLSRLASNTVKRFRLL